MKIGVLTSSRADYGIYVPLLKSLAERTNHSISLIAFGTHLSDEHGNTVSEIEKDSFGEILKVKHLIKDGDTKDIAESYADVATQFSTFWNEHRFDLVLCLGDRYEMSAAVQASIPYRVRLAHFHGGETTLGAIDNIYRHQISLASEYHFLAAEEFRKKLLELLNPVDGKKIVNTGSISLSDLDKIETLSQDDFYDKFNIPKENFVMCTIHPETNSPESNQEFADIYYKTIKKLSEHIHFVVNYPNADTNGSIYREKLNQLTKEGANVTPIESFGKIGYFSALNHCSFLLGNSSSGIIEAASFGKYAINTGDRQAGRLRSDNIIDVAFNQNEIEKAFHELMTTDQHFNGENKYTQPNTISIILDTLEKIENGEL